MGERGDTGKGNVGALLTRLSEGTFAPASIQGPAGLWNREKSRAPTTEEPRSGTGSSLELVGASQDPSRDLKGIYVIQ